MKVMQRVKKYLRSCFSGNVRKYLLDGCRLAIKMCMKFHVKIILAAKKVHSLAQHLVRNTILVIISYCFPSRNIQ